VSDTQEILAPFPGIFYRRTDPGSDPLVELGQEIEVGDVIALVEVMKMFHEVHSTIAGTVMEFCVEDGDAIAMGQSIAKIAPRL